ncbi:OB-fold nucleic acid binding domain-containing protein [Nocardioides sp.]|uniref:OB-fold nucleic acid binding domain-containing protein n=1 Tax=Nocardioides sp. TaxID=35761 RepID=UPI002ED5BAE6
MAEKTGLRARLSRWASSGPDLHAEQLRREIGDQAEHTISEAPDRAQVTVQGQLRTVTLRPRGGVPALEAELDDGSAVLVVVWLGRRQITGIAPGRNLRVTGRIGVFEGVRSMYNPRYELLP